MADAMQQLNVSEVVDQSRSCQIEQLADADFESYEFVPLPPPRQKQHVICERCDVVPRCNFFDTG